MVLALVGDLLFRSKIEALATATGAEVVTALPTAGVTVPAGTSRVLVDLAAEGDPIGAIEAVRRAAPEVEIIGFYPHVEAALKRAALAAGATRAVSRGAFVESLADWLGGGREG